MSEEKRIDPAEGFEGTVQLIENMPAPDGTWTSVFSGFVRILSADVTGMTPARGDTPWVAEVSGETGKVWVPGCKVSSVSNLPIKGDRTVWRID